MNPSQSPLDNSLQELKHKLDQKAAVIGIVGLGYVGLPIAVAYAKQGFRTLGIDLSPEKVVSLNAGTSYIQDVESVDVQQALEANLFTVHDNFDAIPEADVIFICVPTPVTRHKDPDISYIESAATSISKHLRRGQLIILKSTTFPSTTEEFVLPILEDATTGKSHRVGKDFALAFSPERVDPGNREFTTDNTPIIVGGVTDACTTVAVSALSAIIKDVHPVSSPRVAEMAKLLENIFRSVNIALANELAQLCDRMGGLSMWEVVEAATTKPFGFMPFYPGPGLGGHCIPIDPYYLSWLARKFDFETSFITLSARVNEQMPFYVGNSVLRALAEQPVGLKDAKVLILGVAFKKDVDDTRHSPALKVIEILHAQGVKNIAYSDPYVPEINVSLPNENLRLHSIELNETQIKDHSVVVILTDHSSFPYSLVAEHAHAIVDTRNAMNGTIYDRENVYLLGGGSF